MPADIWETYSAFANTEGGTILLGVSEEEGQLVISGIEKPERVLDAFWAQIHKPHKVSKNLLQAHSARKLPTADGLWVIAIDVPRASRRERPVFLDGNPLTGTYKRLHSGDYRCSTEEVLSMITEQTEEERHGSVPCSYVKKPLES